MGELCRCNSALLALIATQTANGCESHKSSTRDSRNWIAIVSSNLCFLSAADYCAPASCNRKAAALCPKARQNISI